MQPKVHLKDRLTLLLFWILTPIIIVFLTWQGFNIILHYYAPYGSSITIPSAKLVQPLEVVTALEVYDKQSVVQPFTAQFNGLGRIDLQVVTWSDRPRPHDVLWQLSEVKDDNSKIIEREGSFKANSVKDWGQLFVKFKPVNDSKCKNYELSFSAPKTDQSESMGFPFFKNQELDKSTNMSSEILNDLTQPKVHSHVSIPTLFYYFTENYN